LDADLSEGGWAAWLYDLLKPHVHRELGGMPNTMNYGRAVDDLRHRYREWIWDAEFRDALGAKVLVGGKPHTAYTVFHRKDGRRAVAFANMSDTEHIHCEVVLENAPSGGRHLISPEEPDSKPWPGKLDLAPGYVAVVLES